MCNNVFSLIDSFKQYFNLSISSLTFSDARAVMADRQVNLQRIRDKAQVCSELLLIKNA